MKKGFTLIELLVVIAIIGILAGITLAVLSSARDKARDTEVKGMMDQIRKQAEIYYSANGNYGESFTGYCAYAVGGGAGIPGVSGSIPAASTDNIFGPNVDEGVFPILVEVMKTLNHPWYSPAIGNTDVGCFSQPATADRWAIVIPLPSDDARWCADSAGYNDFATGLSGGLCTQ